MSHYYGKAEQAAQRVMQVFQSGDVPAALAPIFIRRKDNVPCRAWSWSNQLLTALAGHDDEVFGLAFRADGSRLATASLDRTVRLWDLERGRQLADPLTGHDGQVHTVDFDADGSRLVAGTNPDWGAGAVQAWEDGIGWTDLGFDPMTDWPDIYALANLGGDLIVGGQIDTLGSDGYVGVARFDGQQGGHRGPIAGQLLRRIRGRLRRNGRRGIDRGRLWSRIRRHPGAHGRRMDLQRVPRR